jgi:hypothetical protein
MDDLQRALVITRIHAVRESLDKSDNEAVILDACLIVLASALRDSGDLALLGEYLRIFAKNRLRELNREREIAMTILTGEAQP